MIPVHFQIPMANRRSWRRYLATRTVELPSVPREGEEVVVAPGGWSEPVKHVWWDLEEQCVKVELGRKTSSNCVEFDVDDPSGDMRVFARDAGWDIS